MTYVDRFRVAPGSRVKLRGGEGVSACRSSRRIQAILTRGRAIPVTTLFLDVGGVLLSNGWDHHARRRAATTFKLELAELEARHHLTFESYEDGSLGLQGGQP